MGRGEWSAEHCEARDEGLRGPHALADVWRVQRDVMQDGDGVGERLLRGDVLGWLWRGGCGVHAWMVRVDAREARRGARMDAR